MKTKWSCPFCSEKELVIEDLKDKIRQLENQLSFYEVMLKRKESNERTEEDIQIS